MKFKYFLRGLGVGFLFCSLIFVAAYQTSPNKLLTDEDVIARAKELGMVEAPTKMEELLNEQTSETSEESSESSTTEAPTEMQSTEEQTSEGQTSEEQTTESTTESTTEEPTTEATTEEVTTEATSEEVTTEATSEEPSTEQKEVSAKITIKRGMQSITVARMLEREGIVTDADDFDRYLNKHGYSTKLRVGTYTVKNSYSYEKLAKILTGRS